ncbi:MAG: YitT family protein [Bacilli bacterium]|jgi:uncharacterized membrane-anchored protein YitT (DUF2179 family)|nr:YitT family protein [Bacilli bacterium]
MMKKFSWRDLSPKNFLFLTIAGIINAIGVTMFLIPLMLFDSGFSGTAFLLNSITPPYLTLSIFLIVLNFPLFILGTKKMGLQFILYSLYAISIYSFAAFIIQNWLPIDWSNGSPFIGNDIFLAAIFGGLLSGIGSGLTIRSGGALDGVEVIAILVHKRLSTTVGAIVMVYNVILYLLVAVIYSSWIIPLYSIVTYMIGQRAVDFVVEGLDRGKAAIIITEEPNKIAEAISSELKRGVTFWSGYGYYSQKGKTILYVVVNRFEIGRLKSIVKNVDDRSFVTISEVTDVMGVDLKFGKSEYSKIGE